MILLFLKKISLKPSFRTSPSEIRNPDKLHYYNNTNHYSTALILLPLLLLCLFATACNESPEQTYSRLEKTGTDYFAANNYQLALETWQQMAPIKSATPNLHEKIGDTYFKLASYNNAIQAYSETLRLQPENWQARFKTAKTQLLLLDIFSAEENWNQIKSHINTTDSLIFHGDLLSLKKEYVSAEIEYRKALSEKPEHQTALIRLALCLLGQNKTAEAEKTFNTLESLNPKSPDILLQMSHFCSLQNKFTQAGEHIQKAMKLKPEDLNLHLSLAKLLIGTQRYKEATKVLQQLQQKSPNNRHIKKLLIDSLLLANQDTVAKILLETLNSEEEKDLEFQLLKGKYFLKNKAYHAALSQFQLVLEKEPDLPLAHYYKALSYLAGGQNKLGEKSLIKSLTLNPIFTEAELALADIYFKNERYDIALEHADRIKSREPENYRPHLITANIYLAQGEYSKAQENYHNTQFLYPEALSPQYYLARIYKFSGETEKSLQTYKTLLEKDPQLADVVVHYAHTLSNTKKEQQALHFLIDKINEQPTNHYLHNTLGEIHLAMDNRNDAINSFTLSLTANPTSEIPYLKLFDLHAKNTLKLENILKKAIETNKNVPEATNKLAKYYTDNKQPDKAITLLQEAVAAHPNSPYLAANLAWLYIEYQQEDIDEAMRLAQIAYERLPENATVADTLGWIYFKKNMPTRAIWLLEQANNLTPGNKDILSHLKTVKETL